ncbi:MAG: MBL fold metallo-hydrolase [Acidimicrobiales bacterium]
MTAREIVMLGTASMSPTRHRNHNGYALRWDDRLVFFDPGEGFQRQCTIAGIAIARADAVCLTHFHGDHCLGLPGLIARRGADNVPDPLDVYFPADGIAYYDKLQSCTASAYHPPLTSHPIETPGVVGTIGDLTLTALPLRHRVTAFGYRLQEPDSLSFDADELAAVRSPDPTSAASAEMARSTHQPVVSLSMRSRCRAPGSRWHS